MRVLPHLALHPRVGVLGFSGVTALHLALQARGWRSIHGRDVSPNPEEHDHDAIDFREATRLIHQTLPLAKGSRRASNVRFGFRGNCPRRNRVGRCFSRQARAPHGSDTTARFWFNAAVPSGRHEWVRCPQRARCA
jgi:hypothetical protein